MTELTLTTQLDVGLPSISIYPSALAPVLVPQYQVALSLFTGFMKPEKC